MALEYVAPPVVLAFALVAILLASGPRGGHYAGTASSTDSHASTLPVSFMLDGRDLRSLTLGPARLTCIASGRPRLTLPMPKLTNFPPHSSPAQAAQYTRHLLLQGGIQVNISGLFENGTKLLARRPLQIHYKANATGAPNPTGPTPVPAPGPARSPNAANAPNIRSRQHRPRRSFVRAKLERKLRRPTPPARTPRSRSRASRGRGSLRPPPRAARERASRTTSRRGRARDERRD